uniref:Uncharacterized protein n=1 Tax=Lutzomyia longipalpis TaxID=7200 RepID=A0A7G3B744_LUTLO
MIFFLNYLCFFSIFFIYFINAFFSSHKFSSVLVLPFDFSSYSALHEKNNSNNSIKGIFNTLLGCFLCVGFFLNWIFNFLCCFFLILFLFITFAST